MSDAAENVKDKISKLFMPEQYDKVIDSFIMDLKFKDRRALVTGGGRGIGREVAKALSAYGAKVYVMSRTKENLDSLVKEDSKIVPIVCDITNWDMVYTHVEQISPIHLLVNNAGVAKLQSFLGITRSALDYQMDTNFNAALNVSQAVVHNLIKEGIQGASIVNVSSQAALVGMPNHTIYCASKAALDALTRCMAIELGPKKIRVNSVNPTVVMTDMGKSAWSDASLANRMKEDIPLGRFAEVHEVVDAILYLLSDRASIITGVSLPLDGGFTTK